LKRLSLLLWAGGVALFVGLIAWSGFADVVRAIRHAGIGIAVVTAFHLLPLALDTMAWRALQPRPLRRSLPWLLRARWYGESINTLVPLGQVGGDLLRGHWHARTGVAAPIAMGIAVVDLASEVYAQIGIAALGLVGLAAIVQGHGDLLLRLGATLALLSLLVLGFYAAQRRGLFSRLVRRLEGIGSIGSDCPRAYADALDRTVARLYRRRRPLAAAIALHALSWAVGAAEAWLAAMFIGAPLTLTQALVIESLIYAVRGAAFLVPGALGVQEGAFVVIGALFGLAPDQAVAISLIKRVRELALGIPGLLAWQAGEIRRARSGASATHAGGRLAQP
jgi:putative membrane protein